MVPGFVAQDVIKSIVDAVVAPPLKARGYRRNARTWHKSEDDVIKVLNVQLSLYNSREEAKFTINLGLFHPEFHALRGLTPPRKVLKEYNCDVRLRSGEVMGSGDYWWTVGWNTDNDKTREDLRHHFEHAAIPWLDAARGLEQFPEYFLRCSRHFDAAVALHLLRRPGVSELLATAAASAPSSFRQTLEKWAKVHGYTLPPAIDGSRQS